MKNIKKLMETDPLPLYHQLKNIMKERIENMEWKPGKKIPGEKELAEIYETSVTTVRQAVSILTNEGILIRKQGRGTFVASSKIQKGPKLLTSFTEEMKQKGFDVGTKVLRLLRITPDETVRKALGLPKGEEVFFIQRLRYADGEPIGLQSSYITAGVAKGLEKEDLSGSLYRILEERYGVIIAYADEDYSAVLLEKKIEKMLGLSHPAVGFSVKRTAYSMQGKAVEYTESFMRADKYSISIRLQKNGNAPMR